MGLFQGNQAMFVGASFWCVICASCHAEASATRLSSDETCHCLSRFDGQVVVRVSNLGATGGHITHRVLLLDVESGASQQSICRDSWSGRKAQGQHLTVPSVETPGLD